MCNAAIRVAGSSHTKNLPTRSVMPSLAATIATLLGLLWKDGMLLEDRQCGSMGTNRGVIRRLSAITSSPISKVADRID